MPPTTCHVVPDTLRDVTEEIKGLPGKEDVIFAVHFKQDQLQDLLDMLQSPKRSLPCILQLSQETEGLVSELNSGTRFQVLNLCKTELAIDVSVILRTKGRCAIEIRC
jgi:hypothetical protein